jgi:alpha-L-fucosidase
MAKQAGMKYIVITSKHHDGFCLFDTDHTDYNVVDATPFKRDIIRELAEECAKQGLKFGVYYSQFQDWTHRGLKKGTGTLPEPDYLEMVNGHLDELLKNYGEMSVLWFDTGGSDVAEANRQGEMVRRLQPRAVICSRLYNRGVPKEQQRYSDFESLPDRTVASARVTTDTETCMTMRHNWGYDQDDKNWKSAKDILERLVLSTSRGVNFLLNVGPKPEGVLCPEEIERLKAIGAWMDVNGESIYATTPSPLDFDFPWGAMTFKGKTLYLHVMKWTPGTVVFDGVLGTPAKAYFLADPEKQALEVSVKEEGNVTTVTVPQEAPDAMDTVIVLEYPEAVRANPKATGKYHWVKTTGLKGPKPPRNKKK